MDDLTQAAEASTAKKWFTWLREDIEFWTEILRRELDCAEARSAIEQRGLDPQSVLLISLVDKANGISSGVILTPEEKVLEFKMNPVSRLASWQDRTGDLAFIEKCPHVLGGVQLVRRRGRRYEIARASSS